MSNTQDNLTGLSDEALDPVPAQEASACGRACGTIYCNISDETLDPAPAQEAFPFGCIWACSVCHGVSDEALDPSPAQEALGGCGIFCVGPICTISDETLDTPGAGCGSLCLPVCHLRDQRRGPSILRPRRRR